MGRNIKHIYSMALNLQEEYNKTDIQGIIDQLEEDLVGLAPVKARIKEIAALLLVQRLRKNLGLGINSTSVGLHMSFTGSPGTGKTAVANRMADILYKLGYIRKGLAASSGAADAAAFPALAAATAPVE